jgi:hypothetical protein
MIKPTCNSLRLRHHYYANNFQLRHFFKEIFRSLNEKGQTKKA